MYIRNVITGVYLIVKDITKQKEAEEVVLKSKKLTAVGQLAAAIAHEIRNPLTSLMGFVKIIEHSSHADQEYYQIMLDELSRINSITNELLVLSKPQAENFDIHDVNELVKDIVYLLESQAALENINLKLNVENGPLFVESNAQQLKQVFLNLIKNAIEAMTQPGTVTIDVKEIGEEKVVFRVEDEGHGMSKEQIKKIGEPFYSTKEKGTGLGMLVTYKIIERHQGDLNVESQVGKGTTISVLLPKA